MAEKLYFPHTIFQYKRIKSPSQFPHLNIICCNAAPGGKYDKESVKQLGGQANVIARKEFGYLDNWEMYPNFTTHGNTFIFVRHPFERILSAFRDKLEDPSVRGIKFNEYYYNKYGRRVVMYYRKEKITGPSFKYPRFNEFIDFLVDKARSLKKEFKFCYNF